MKLTYSNECLTSFVNDSIFLEKEVVRSFASCMLACFARQSSEALTAVNQAFFECKENNGFLIADFDCDKLRREWKINNVEKWLNHASYEFNFSQTRYTAESLREEMKKAYRANMDNSYVIYFLSSYDKVMESMYVNNNLFLSSGNCGSGISCYFSPSYEVFDKETPQQKFIVEMLKNNSMLDYYLKSYLKGYFDDKIAKLYAPKIELALKGEYIGTPSDIRNNNSESYKRIYALTNFLNKISESMANK